MKYRTGLLIIALLLLIIDGGLVLLDRAQRRALPPATQRVIEAPPPNSGDIWQLPAEWSPAIFFYMRIEGEHGDICISALPSGFMWFTDGCFGDLDRRHIRDI